MSLFLILVAEWNILGFVTPVLQARPGISESITRLLGSARSSCGALLTRLSYDIMIINYPTMRSWSSAARASGATMKLHILAWAWISSALAAGPCTGRWGTYRFGRSPQLHVRMLLHRVHTLRSQLIPGCSVVLFICFFNIFRSRSTLYHSCIGVFWLYCY
jgi:hypothetical protein